MTAEGLTDLILALACAGLIWRLRGGSPGLRVALAIIGTAALLGVARFEGLAWAIGPHRFAVTVASTAAMPLLGWVLCWPGSLPATQPRAAAIAIVFGGALGVLLAGLAGLQFWVLLCHAMAAAWLMYAVWRHRAATLAAGVGLLLLVGMVQATGIGLAGLPPTAIVHLLLAGGLALAGLASDRLRH